MRSIGARCGLTAAGIYRHCRDKEDLFEQLVSTAAEKVDQWIEGHIAGYVDTARADVPCWKDPQADLMRELIYPNMEEYRLLLARSRGTKYENYLGELIEFHEKELTNYMDILSGRGQKVCDIDQKELHLLLTAYTTALFEPVMKDYTEEEALRCLDALEAFFLPGWKKLLGF